MQEVFEKIINELKQESIIVDDDAGNREMEIIEQAADEYNNGWIPCSERLPEEKMEVIVTISEMDGNNHTSTSWLQDDVWIIKKTPYSQQLLHGSHC